MPTKSPNTITITEIRNLTINTTNDYPPTLGAKLPPPDKVLFFFGDAADGDVIAIEEVIKEAYTDVTRIMAGTGKPRVITYYREVSRTVLAKGTVGHTKKKGWHWK